MGRGHRCRRSTLLRIFNPITQGKKFDPQGEYVRRWVPELAGLPTQYIHSPWLAPDRAVADAGIRIGKDYPAPIVELTTSRKATLAAYEAMRRPEEKSAAKRTSQTI
jgi:deoxyribodipyrimidine photo-lyase